VLPVLITGTFRHFTLRGSFLIAAHVQTSLFGLLWGLWIITVATLSPTTRTLMVLAYPIVVMSILVGIIQSFEQWEVVCRRSWKRRGSPWRRELRKHYPKISLHVPAYAEPPELVIATLDALAKLPYPNLEVLVIDNNTQDPALVFGRGLIPESFEDYKKQRFRWTYGPIQELRRHFRLFLPKPFAQPSALSGAQKVHHLIHGLGAMKSGMEFMLLPLGIALTASMLAHHESIQVPLAMWPVFPIAAIAALALKWHLFRRAVCCSFKDMLGASLASMSLDYIVRMASLLGVCTRNTPWRRTNKFRSLPLGLGTLSSALPELLLGLVTWVASVVVLVAFHPRGLLHISVVGGMVQSAQFLAAPVVTVIAEHGIRLRSSRSVSPATPGDSTASDRAPPRSRSAGCAHS
jgi:hypothetical protein